MPLEVVTHTCRSLQRRIPMCCNEISRCWRGNKESPHYSCNSEAFHSELENILRGQLEGTGELKKTMPQSPGAISPGRAEMGHKSRHPSSKVASMMGGGIGGEPVIPINDLRGTDASKYTVAERDQRCKLASVYRLVHMFGWSQLIYNHITVSHSFTCTKCILSKGECSFSILLAWLAIEAFSPFLFSDKVSQYLIV